MKVSILQTWSCGVGAFFVSFDRKEIYSNKKGNTEYELEFKIPANTRAKFTFSSRIQNTRGNLCKSLIFDSKNIRDVKQQIYCMYITVRDYR